MIKVLLVDDHGLVRAGLKRVLEEEADMHVIGEACSGQEAVQEFNTKCPDVVVMDISMPDMDGLEAAKKLLSLHHDARILVLTMHPEEHYAVRTLKAGCLGYVTKGVSTRQLRDAVRAVAGGRRYLSDEAKDTVMVQLLADRPNSTPIDRLSDRELEIICLLARGLKLKEVAIELGLSVRTVETYQMRARRKLGLRNKAQITRFAYENKLIQGYD